MNTKQVFLFLVLILLAFSAGATKSRVSDPPLIEEIPLEQEDDDPSEDPLNLVVYLNTAIGQIYVETYVNQWIWVYITNVDTGAIYYWDVIDGSLYNGTIYHTSAPTMPGNYSISFMSNNAEAHGYFSIVS